MSSSRVISESFGARGRSCIVLIVVVAGLFCSTRMLPVYGANATVLDAKRDAAQKIAKDGKTTDAISLWHEIIADPGHEAKDYLNLARLEDKLSHNSETKSAYRLFLEMSVSPKDLEERQGRAEADKRLKALDVMGGKIDAALEGFSIKLDSLEREAIASKDTDGYDRIFRIRGSLIRSEKPANAGYCEVSATWAAYTDSGFRVKKGDKLQISTRGTWKYNKTSECTAGGVKGQTRNGQTLWVLTANIENNGYWVVGDGATITVTHSGLLYFGPNADPNNRKDCSGSVMVMIRRE